MLEERTGEGESEAGQGQLGGELAEQPSERLQWRGGGFGGDGRQDDRCGEDGYAEGCGLDAR